MRLETFVYALTLASLLGCTESESITQKPVFPPDSTNIAQKDTTYLSVLNTYYKAVVVDAEVVTKESVPIDSGATVTDIAECADELADPENGNECHVLSIIQSDSTRLDVIVSHSRFEHIDLLPKPKKR